MNAFEHFSRAKHKNHERAKREIIIVPLTSYVLINFCTSKLSTEKLQTLPEYAYEFEYLMELCRWAYGLIIIIGFLRLFLMQNSPERYI